MKKTLVIITAILMLSMWLVDCRMTGDQDYVSDFIYHMTPSPTITPTHTNTPYVTPTPTCSGLFCSRNGYKRVL
jgi:hypothetical protein